jgi:hypothetical protein
MASRQQRGLLALSGRPRSEAHCALLYQLSPFLSGQPRAYRSGAGLNLSLVKVSLLRINPIRFPSQERFAGSLRRG